MAKLGLSAIAALYGKELNPRTETGIYASSFLFLYIYNRKNVSYGNTLETFQDFVRINFIKVH